MNRLKSINMQIFWKDFAELNEQEKQQAIETASRCGYNESQYPSLAFQVWEDRVQGLAHKDSQIFTEKFY